MFSAVRTSLEQMSRRERIHFNALLTARTLTAILDVLGVLLIGLVGAIAAGSISTTAGSISLFGISVSDLSGPRTLLILAAITLGFFVLKAVIAIALTRRLTIFVATVESRTASQLTAKLLAEGLSKLQSWRTSELTYGLTYSMNAAYGRLLSHYTTLVAEGFLLFCIAIALSVVSPVTMIVMVLYFGLIGWLIQVFVGRRQQRAGLLLADSTINSTTALTESIGAFREIFTLGRQPYFVERFRRPRTSMSDSGATVQFVMTLPRHIVEAALLLGAVALIASQLLSNNVATAASTLAIFLTAGFRIMASLLPLQAAAGSIRQVSAESELAHRLLLDFAATPAPQVRDGRPTAADDRSTGVEISLSKVTFTYDGASAPALLDVDFSARPGEYCAIIGASGAGKSTLADMLLGLIQPTSGSIELDGMTPHQVDVTMPGSIAYVPQRPGLVAGSILENVALGIEPEQIDQDRVEWALRQANLLDHVMTLPEGLTTSVGKQSNALSGGQIQRLGLARALYVRPRLLVLDEATSALDAESESIVGDSLKELIGSVTMVVIAHRLSTVQHAETVHVMDAGRIIASGSFAHLVKTVPMVARYAELMSLDEPKP